MRKSGMVCLLLAIAGGMSGCNKLAGSGNGGGSSAPAEAVGTFLTAICSANQEKMFGMLTDEVADSLKGSQYVAPIALQRNNLV